MHFIGSILTAIFVTLLIFFVLSFGFALITIITLVFFGLAALIMLRSTVRRWLFLYHARVRTDGRATPEKMPVRKPEANNGTVIIDADYKEIKRPWRNR